MAVERAAPAAEKTRTTSGGGGAASDGNHENSFFFIFTGCSTNGKKQLWPLQTSKEQLETPFRSRAPCSYPTVRGERAMRWAASITMRRLTSQSRESERDQIYGERKREQGRGVVIKDILPRGRRRDEGCITNASPRTRTPERVIVRRSGTLIARKFEAKRR